MSEQYFNNFQTTIANGGAGYVAGSGVLNVLSTSPITLAAGDTTRLSIYTGSPELVVILKVTAVNSSTQFAVTAETTDANANDGDLVLNTLTVGGMDQIRTDQNSTFSGSLPSSIHIGDMRTPSDDIVTWIDVNGSLAPFGPFYTLTPPNAADFSWRNQGGASATARNGSIFLQGTQQSGDNLRLYEQAAPSTPYSFVAGFSVLMVSANYCNIGLGFDDGTKMEVMCFSYNTSFNGFCLNVSKWNSVTSFNSQVISLPFIPASGMVFFKVRNDGTNIYFYVGLNPIDFVEVFSEAKGTFLGSITDVCLALDGNSTSFAAVNAITLFHWEQGT
jgi:hypothetical protein